MSGLESIDEGLDEIRGSTMIVDHETKESVQTSILWLKDCNGAGKFSWIRFNPA